jgi:hypothetical protein
MANYFCRSKVITGLASNFLSPCLRSFLCAEARIFIGVSFDSIGCRFALAVSPFKFSQSSLQGQTTYEAEPVTSSKFLVLRHASQTTVDVFSSPTQLETPCEHLSLHVEIFVQILICY